MSPKGTQPTKVAGLQFVLNPCPARLLSIDWARLTHAPPPPRSRAPAMEGFKPPGRKKFISAELTHGPSEPDPQGTAPVPTVNGLLGVCPAAMAALKFCTIKSPRTVLALIGRLR